MSETMIEAATILCSFYRVLAFFLNHIELDLGNCLILHLSRHYLIWFFAACMQLVVNMYRIESTTPASSRSDGALQSD